MPLKDVYYSQFLITVGRPCPTGSQREASSDEQAEGVREKSKPAPLLGFQQEG